MIDREIVELINREIDGDNSPEDHARLQLRLEADDEARRLMEELRQLAADLSGVPAVEPPQSLKAGIMNTLPIPGRRSAKTPPRVLSAVASLWNILLRPPVLALISGILLGGAIAALVFILLFRPAADTMDAAGAFIPRLASAAEWSEKVETTRGDIHLRAEAGRSGTLDVLTLQVTSASRVHAALSFDSGALDVQGIQKNDGSTNDISLIPGQMEIRGTGIACTIVLQNRQQTALPVRIVVYSENTPSIQETIVVE